jgi:tRNA A37 threonylcarbamoyladenosine dehydratase
MDTCRSYYLNSRQDDFAELDADKCHPDTTDIAYVIPANDNVPTKVRLSARCRALLRRLMAIQSLSWPN